MKLMQKIQYHDHSHPKIVELQSDTDVIQVLIDRGFPFKRITDSLRYEWSAHITGWSLSLYSNDTFGVGGVLSPRYIESYTKRLEGSFQDVLFGKVKDRQGYPIGLGVFWGLPQKVTRRERLYTPMAPDSVAFCTNRVKDFVGSDPIPYHYSNENMLNPEKCTNMAIVLDPAHTEIIEFTETRERFVITRGAETNYVVWIEEGRE